MGQGNVVRTAEGLLERIQRAGADVAEHHTYSTDGQGQDACTGMRDSIAAVIGRGCNSCDHGNLLGVHSVSD